MLSYFQQLCTAYLALPTAICIQGNLYANLLNLKLICKLFT